MVISALLMTMCFLIANSGEVSYLVKLICVFLAVVNGMVSYSIERRLLVRVHRLEQFEKALSVVVVEKRGEGK